MTTPSSTDLIVAGGGPVGLGTAIEAALAGFAVTVVEPRVDPVDKACGEGLMPGAVAALARLGVAPAGREFVGIAYVEGRHRAQGLFRGGPGLGVRRTVLHTALAARADELGVRRVTGRVADVRQDDTGVTARGPQVEQRARWLVAADGLHSPLRRALGLDQPPGRPGATPGAPGRYGLRRHFRARPWSDVVEVHWHPDAECYVTPVAEDLVGVAVLRDGEGGSYATSLKRFPAILERLAGAPAVTSVRGAGPLRQRVISRRAGRVLLAGDAAGYVDAITGEGVAVGLAGARELVDCLVRGTPEEYDRRWLAVSRRYRVLTGALLWARSRPAVRARIVPAARRVPMAFSALVDQVAR